VVVLAVLAAGAVCIFVAPRFWPVLVANAALAVVGEVFAPAVAGLTLGLVRSQALARRMGRNAVYDHAGNVAIAAVAGAIGWRFSQRVVFLLAPVFAVLAAAAAVPIIRLLRTNFCPVVAWGFDYTHMQGFYAILL